MLGSVVYIFTYLTLHICHYLHKRCKYTCVARRTYCICYQGQTRRFDTKNSTDLGFTFSMLKLLSI